MSIERDMVEDFRAIFAGGKAKIRIERANGYVEERDVTNQVLAAGLNELALGMVNSRGLYNWIAVGTLTAIGSLGSTWAGEVSRKQGAIITTSKNVVILVCTWGGAADGVTSVALETAAIVNHTSSGGGIPLNYLTGVAATLANSDHLHLQMEFRIGSHNL